LNFLNVDDAVKNIINLVGGVSFVKKHIARFKAPPCHRWWKQFDWQPVIRMLPDPLYQCMQFNQARNIQGE